MQVYKGQQLKVWTVKVERPDGASFEMRVSGTTNREDTMKLARSRIVDKKFKIRSCRHTSTELILE